MRPEVSIILPAFNRLAYLRAAVGSVLAQTFTDWELIIADDGSGEETLAYLDELAKLASVTVLRLSHRGNPPAVRNEALRRARGRLIAFIDSDDRWAAAKLERQVTALRACPERRWSYGAFQLVDATLRPLSRAPHFAVCSGSIIAALLGAETTIVQSSVIADRALFERLGPYDESLPWCGDFELWARFALHSPVECIAEPLVLVRRHAEHCCDDVAACEDFVRALDTIRPRLKSPAHLAILQRRRAVAAAVLARSRAASGQRRAALAALLESAPRSFAYRQWWRGAAHAAARALAPDALWSGLRRMRARHARSSPQG